MSLRLTETQVAALQRAVADGTMPPATVHAMLIGPSPVSASGRRQTADLSRIPYAVPTADAGEADRPV